MPGHAATPFELTQPLAQILAIVFFLLPGLNATWILERLAGRTTLRPTERLFRAIAFSVVVYALGKSLAPPVGASST